MTEEEAKKALFQIHYEYMTYPPSERLEHYDEYREKRATIRKALVQLILNKKEEEAKAKKSV